MSSVDVPSRNENRRPRVSAITPVGTSNRTWPTVKNALAANAWVLSSPASSRNRVLMPQMNDAARVVNSVRVRYVRWTATSGRAIEPVYVGHPGIRR